MNMKEPIEIPSFLTLGVLIFDDIRPANWEGRFSPKDDRRSTETLIYATDYFQKEIVHEGYVYKIVRYRFGTSTLLGHIFLSRKCRKANGEALAYYVYSIFQQGKCVYVGATFALAKRTYSHRRRWPGCFLCVLHVTTAKDIKRLEAQEIKTHHRKWPNLENRTKQSAYSPVRKRRFQPPVYDPMNDPAFN
jgi:hypothetical protein